MWYRDDGEAMYSIIHKLNLDELERLLKFSFFDKFTIKKEIHKRISECDKKLHGDFYRPKPPTSGSAITAPKKR